MTTFNGQEYIEEQLKSILTQLSPTDELIISDDGSSDETLTILNKYQEMDERIVLLDGPRKGVIANFEHAIATSKGDIIFLADQDDVWLEHKVEVITTTFNENPNTMVVVSDLVIVDSQLSVTESSYFSFRKAKEGWVHNLIRSNYIGAGMAFRSSMKATVLPIPAKVPMHDMWIGLMAGNQVRFIYQPLTLYRRHEDNVSEIKTTTSFMQKLSWRWQLTQAIILRRLHLK
ncbi:MAG: glycosyltransferase family 2 protein [Enterococcus sp.]